MALESSHERCRYFISDATHWGNFLPSPQGGRPRDLGIGWSDCVRRFSNHSKHHLQKLSSWKDPQLEFRGPLTARLSSAVLLKRCMARVAGLPQQRDVLPGDRVAFGTDCFEYILSRSLEFLGEEIELAPNVRVSKRHAGGVAYGNRSPCVRGRGKEKLKGLQHGRN
jgi:hypothetical protein